MNSKVSAAKRISLNMKRMKAESKLKSKIQPGGDIDYSMKPLLVNNAPTDWELRLILTHFSGYIESIHSNG